MADQEKDPIDLSKILLPKKEPPNSSLDSAQRVSAGALFAQEQRAGLEGPEQEPPRRRDEHNPNSSGEVPAPAPDTTTQPLQTYQSDIESLVQKGGVSEVSIAAAEAVRRGKTKEKEESVPEPRDFRAWTKWVYIAMGVLLVTTAVGLVGFALLRPTTVPVVSTGAHAAIIFIDETHVVPLNAQRTPAMAALEAARKAVKLSVGLMARLVPLVPTPAGQEQVAYAADDFLSLIAPNVPAELLRTLEPGYLLGVHSFDENQALLIVQVDSFEVAYRAMLEWEVSMYAELSPLFVRVPPTRITQTPAPTPEAGTTTASTTPAAPVVSIINTDFVDKIVENRDARVLQSTAGDILLLWTFLDRNTIVITTNEATLREVLSRRAQAPMLTLPQ